MKNNNSSGAFNSYYDRYEKNDINAIEITDTRVIELKEISEKHKLGYFRLDKQRQKELNYFAKKYKETNKDRITALFKLDRVSTKEHRVDHTLRNFFINNGKLMAELKI